MPNKSVPKLRLLLNSLSIFSKSCISQIEVKGINTVLSRGELEFHSGLINYLRFVKLQGHRIKVLIDPNTIIALNELVKIFKEQGVNLNICDFIEYTNLRLCADRWEKRTVFELLGFDNETLFISHSEDAPCKPQKAHFMKLDDQGTFYFSQN